MHISIVTNFLLFIGATLQESLNVHHFDLYFSLRHWQDSQIFFDFLKNEYVVMKDNNERYIRIRKLTKYCAIKLDVKYYI